MKAPKTSQNPFSPQNISILVVSITNNTISFVGAEANTNKQPRHPSAPTQKEWRMKSANKVSLLPNNPPQKKNKKHQKRRRHKRIQGAESVICSHLIIQTLTHFLLWRRVFGVKNWLTKNPLEKTLLHRLFQKQKRCPTKVTKTKNESVFRSRHLNYVRWLLRKLLSRNPKLKLTKKSNIRKNIVPKQKTIYTILYYIVSSKKTTTRRASHLPRPLLLCLDEVLHLVRMNFLGPRSRGLSGALLR